MQDVLLRLRQSSVFAHAHVLPRESLLHREIGRPKWQVAEVAASDSLCQAGKHAGGASRRSLGPHEPQTLNPKP